jgi:hypothetical protein
MSEKEFSAIEGDVIVHFRPIVSKIFVGGKSSEITLRAITYMISAGIKAT